MSPVLLSNTLVCMYLLYSTLFPWGEINRIPLYKKFLAYSFCCRVLPAGLTFFVLCYACKLWLWYCKGCMPMQSMNISVAATYHAAHKTTGACAPTKEIPRNQPRKQSLIVLFTNRDFFYLFVFQTAPLMQSEGKKL